MSTGPGRGRRRAKAPTKPKITDQETLTLEITHWGAQGDGIAHSGGTPLYIPGTVVGDWVTAERTQFASGKTETRLVSILSKSADRQDPACQHFERCGGCTLQMLRSKAYHDWIKARLLSVFAQHDLEPETLGNAILSPPGSRRRLAMKARKLANTLVLGFTEGKSHTIVQVDQCPVAHPLLTRLFGPIRDMLTGLLETGQQIGVHLTQTSTGIDLVLEGQIRLDLQTREALTEFARSQDLAAFHIKEDGFLDPVLVQREPALMLDGVAVTVPPASFLQATEDGQNALVQAVLKHSVSGGKALDLFSGLGTFSVPLGRRMTVHAVEGQKSALVALSLAAGRAGDRAITTEHRDLFRRPLRPNELAPYDLAVFDPPRAGAEAQALALARSDIPTVIGVSCNPSTFARDARILCDGGYQLSEVTPVDQFLWSPHLELVGVFKRT